MILEWFGGPFDGASVKHPGPAPDLWSVEYDVPDGDQVRRARRQCPTRQRLVPLGSKRAQAKWFIDWNAGKDVA